MKRISFFAACVLCAASAFAWSQKGHDVVAHIAECHLSKVTADSVAAILDGKSPVYWANWLDNASHTADYAYTKTWHYKNVDADQTYESAPKNPAGDVVTAIREQIDILRSPKSTKAQKSLAMKILVHIVGDMHQPMHMGHLSDLGGNKRQVRFFDRGTNLHAIWDGSLMNAGHSWTYTEWRDQLDRLNPEQEAAETAGNVDDWARQTLELVEPIYTYFPSGAKVSYNAIARWTPTIETQLLRGGLRLARILNAIYDPASPDYGAEF
ncbi:MAG: S1/P1 nuclease [Muribaculaceae bacterium]|nr:S1/P1 nuclease [Muribaculaceae bacterium]